MSGFFDTLLGIFGIAAAFYMIFFTKSIRASGARVMRDAGHEVSARIMGSWLYGLFIKAFGFVVLVGFSIILLSRIEAWLIYLHILPVAQ